MKIVDVEIFGRPTDTYVAAGKTECQQTVINLRRLQSGVLSIPGVNQPPVRCEQQLLIRLAHRGPLDGNDTGNRFSPHAAIHGDLPHGKLLGLIQLQNKGGTFSVGHPLYLPKDLVPRSTYQFKINGTQ